MPSTWVFPGGAVDLEDADPPPNFRNCDDWKVAAIREMIEETGLWLTSRGVVESEPTERAFEAIVDTDHDLDGDRLIYFSNWITPEFLPIRFDTRFFLTVVDTAVHGSVDGDELVDLRWVEPHAALADERNGAFDMAFPTRRTLELIGASRSADELARQLESVDDVPPIQPRLFVSDDEARLLLPDDELYDAVLADQADPDLLARLATVVARGGHVPPELRKRR